MIPGWWGWNRSKKPVMSMKLPTTIAIVETAGLNERKAVAAVNHRCAVSISTACIVVAEGAAPAP